MDPRVAAIINEKKEKEIKKYNKNKENFLLDLELYDKVYSPDGQCTDEYPFYDWDEATGTSKFYKKVPIEVTDEEYEALKACSDPANSESSSNGVATTLTVIAWMIYIGGFIAGILAMNEAYDNAFEIACGVWFDAFVSGTIFLAIGEIIKQLFAINKKMKRADKDATTEENDDEE